MLDVADLAARIAPLPPHKQRKVLESYRYRNLSTLNKLRSLLLKLPRAERRDWIRKLPPAAILALTREWRYRARRDQLPPEGPWKVWINVAGRGTGKSQSGLNWTAETVMQYPGEYLVVGKTATETLNKQVLPLIALLRDMGEPLSDRGSIDKRSGKITLSNGSVIYSDAATTVAENVRGYNLSGAWLDELCVYDNPEEDFKQIEYAVRRGLSQIYISTTPLVSGQANKLLRALIKRRGTHYTTTNAYANLENLSVGYIDNLLEEEGKRRAEEEIWAEILEDIGSLFTESMFYDEGDFKFRFRESPPLESFEKVVVAYDPAGSSKATADEHGIIVIGCRKEPHPATGNRLNHYWVLADKSDKYSPNEAARVLSDVYHEYQANAVVAEVNNGCDWITTVINNHDSVVVVKPVVATRGKAVRAEPVVGVYEQKRVRHHHKLGELEGELVTFTPDVRKSPNRADALVWGITYLEGGKVQQWMPQETWLGF